ncbi:hypothetical protein [Nocardioides luteus]|uniref:Uncharacterized protein n=1 Tax=Nocardioides luteus TaxID=1844 RepID=A0A1J4N4B5_9ACTN|nr:hypothetical protein [Nocardioides luteus]OIJ25241.1 hypothetical protein UG56_018580 [Nocardioides luteus]
MPRWVRSYWDEEDVTFLWEVADDGWITRSIELAGPGRKPQAAAALDEVVAASAAGGADAVRAYEARFGTAPEKPLDDWDFPHQAIDESEFEREWREVLDN